MQNKSATICISLLSAVVLLLGALSVWLYIAYESPEELAEREKVRVLTEDLDAAQEQIAAQDTYNEAMKVQLISLTEELQAKYAAIDELEYKVNVLIKNGDAADEYQQILLDKIASLEQDAEKAAERIAELDELIAHYENITTLNFGYQAKKISDLLLFVAESNRPPHMLKKDITDEETGEVVETVTEEVPSKLAFYYRDITTGYTLSYNAEEVMYTASLVKAPYIYALLKSVVDFENNKLYFDGEGNALYDEEGEPLFEGQHPNLDEDGRILYQPGEEKYDLTRVWTFDKEKMMQDGSGKLKGMEDGIELTYLELIEYALLYSDNIAFAQLRALFGYTDYYSVARTIGASGYANGFMQLSAEDCGKFLEAIYAFIEEDTPYSTLLKDALLKSMHTVVIPLGVSPTPVAHKYGWDEDAYHDMGIVYDEHPYVLVVMSDLDQGGNTVNAYLQSVVRSVHSIHKTFYAKK